ncbi:DUF721 domain-containing protein [Polyangium sp. 6x1]|uniref:DUF721 domain-containing protein n=1 Tax=Polyangium sp. 6x1 TaxID=3042689 RepID=UPI00248283C7|nr:DUF721 domain-containing protein [Polyangium sp. 6x1]MDI1445159.1 DUF721 domain-containing protein [Polyangium sp. 6x1]
MEPLFAVLARERGVAPPSDASRSPVSARDWEAAVGSRIAARARPVKLERGVLHVRAASSTWAQELSMLCEPILAQLKARGVAVESLRFRVGPVDPPERAKTRNDVRTAPPAVKLPEALATEIEHVADEALRDAIRRAAAKNLGWQRMRTSRKRTAAPEARVENDERGARAQAQQEDAPVTTTTRAARGPRPAAPGSDPQDRAGAQSSAAPRRTRGSS